MAIAPGTAGPGGARFGAGSGGPNRFDHTQLYAGLWSIGIDPQSPTLKADVQRWYDGQPAAVKSEVQKGLGNQPGRGSLDPLVYAVDWRQRDVARKIQKENGFLQSTFGQVLGTALQIGASFIPGVGPWASAGIGAITGGVTGGFKGALLGGLSGYGVGKATQFVANGGLTALGRSLTGAAGAPGFGQSTALGLGGDLMNPVASNGLGLGASAAKSALAASLYSPASLAGAAATGTGVLGKLMGARKSPTAQALGAASSAASTVRRLAGPAAVTGAGLLTAAGLLSGAGGPALQPTALTSGGSPLVATQPTGYEAAREQARQDAANAVSDSDMVRTTALGLVGKPRTRGKKLLGV
jgi:hypothetical protein